MLPCPPTSITSPSPRGIAVNVTLLSPCWHQQAADAYIRGLRRLRHAGGDLHTVASVASLFVSRVEMWYFLSARLRRWLLLAVAVAVPLARTLIHRLARRTAEIHPDTATNRR